MKKSKSTALMNPRDQSQLFRSPLFSNSRLYNIKKDPFQNLERNGSAKLLPASPSGLRLPSLQGTSTPRIPIKVISVKNLIADTPKYEDLFKFNRLNLQKHCLTVPKTPHFKLRRRDPLINSKEYRSARKRHSETNLDDLSFGNIHFFQKGES